MTELSSLDFRVLVEELQFLAGGKIQKIYHEGKDLHISVFVKSKGTNMLVTGDGKFFTTPHSLKHKERPTGFCMFLRKRLSGQWIDSIRQLGFERILLLETVDYKIYFELFRNGNTIITDKDDKIVSVMSVQIWKDRVLKANEIYKLPPVSYDTPKLDADAFSSALGKSSKNIISFLARDLGFGGNYAEKILSQAKMDKDTSAKELSPMQTKKLFKAISGMLVMKKEPQIILEDSKYADLSSFSLMKYGKSDKKKFSTLNEAADEFYVSKMEIEEEKEVVSKSDKQKGSLEHRLDVQTRSLETVKKIIEECNHKAELIYSNFKLLEDMIRQVNDAGESKGWDFVLKQVKSGKVGKIKSIDLKVKIMVADVSGVSVNIYIDKPLNHSAEMYYQKAKRSKGKIPGIEKSIALTENNLGKLESAPVPKAKLKIRRAVEKKEWFDKFRHFRSSSGFFVLAGKDATSNEVLVKKHTDKDDVIFHADIAGSPFVVIKAEGKNIDKSTLSEAAQFAAAYSKAWKMRAGTVDVFWVAPEQVSKQAPSGEYIQKGSFMVRGKKNWTKPELRLSFALVDGKVICVPLETIVLKTKKYVTIAPGYKKSKAFAKEIRTKLFSLSSKDEQEILREISVDYIQKFIPSGSGEILK
ncbi:MAG: NFACT family protein [Candidatus Aenigmarchaeota archaeon]|nr:NFACT family protein [Candidatus Aenigmarchaeota archaeon]